MDLTYFTLAGSTDFCLYRFLFIFSLSKTLYIPLLINNFIMITTPMLKKEQVLEFHL